MLPEAETEKEQMIYLDNAATTKPLECAMEAFSVSPWGNASSFHSEGLKAAEALEQARESIAADLDCEPDEVYFTSGATEACAWAMHILDVQAVPERAVLAVSAGEHHAVSQQKTRSQRAVLPLNTAGEISPPSPAQLKPKTPLYAAGMLANNEIGVINDIPRLMQKMRNEYPVPLWFTDATAAVGHVPVSFKALGVDYLAFGAHKFGGIKGAGALIIKKGSPGISLISGGGQEHGRRGGTESVPLICAMSAALRWHTERMHETVPRITKLRDRLVLGLVSDIPGAWPNSRWCTVDPSKQLPGTVSMSFEGVSGSALVALLSHEEVYASAGSACTSGDLSPSETLTAMGLSRERALGTVRFSIGHENTEEDIDAVLALMPRLVAHLRALN